MIVVDHDETYSPLSNMPELDANPPANRRIVTFFTDTPQISPSSVAFFVSGFAKSTRTLRRSGMEHLVAVRQTETDHYEKLFEETSRILEAVESFMGVQLPRELSQIHSVALPNFGKEVASFFGFNLYRWVPSILFERREEKVEMVLGLKKMTKRCGRRKSSSFPEPTSISSSLLHLFLLTDRVIPTPSPS
jgi:hypothetical protein